MISMHFNGEMVRHKNMKIIAHRTAEKNAHEGRCKYGCHVFNCSAWLKHCLSDYHKEQDLLKQKGKEIPKLDKFGICKLNGSSLCPQYKERKKQGNTKKTFTIDWKKYRQIASAAHYLIKESEHKTLFLTLSFPQWIRKEPTPGQTYKSRAGLIANHKLTKSFYYDEISNICFTKFAENMRENYDCSGYIAVKEYGETTNRVHFHIIISLPFVDFRILNNSWNNSISDCCCFSSCALRRKPGEPAIIRNPARAIRYVCKYISKTYGQTSETRTVFISNNLLSSKVKVVRRVFDYERNEWTEIETIARQSNIKRSIDENECNHIDYLKQFKSIKINTFEHVTVFKITDRKEFNKFCTQFLYPLFECSVKWSEFYYQPPDIPA